MCRGSPRIDLAELTRPTDSAYQLGLNMPWEKVPCSLSGLNMDFEIAKSNTDLHTEGEPAEI